MIKHQSFNSKGSYNYNAYTYRNRRFSAHFHTNFEAIYAIRGELKLTVGGSSYVMKGGEYALILPNQIHSIDPTPSSLTWIAVFSEQFVPVFAKRIKDTEGCSSIFTCDESVDSMLRENLIYSEGSLMMKKACFYALCDQFIKKVPLERRSTRNDELICKMIDYVGTHFKENISLQTLAKEFGYEYHYLSRLLNDRYRIGFTELVNQYRVDNAIFLLENSDASVTDIAMDSGFRSIRSFNHVFKQVTGYTPTQFIKKETERNS